VKIPTTKTERVGMCGNKIQIAKAVLNNTIIVQVGLSEFSTYDTSA